MFFVSRRVNYKFKVPSTFVKKAVGLFMVASSTFSISTVNAETLPEEKRGLDLVEKEFSYRAITFWHEVKFQFNLEDLASDDIDSGFAEPLTLLRTAGLMYKSGQNKARWGSWNLGICEELIYRPKKEIDIVPPYTSSLFIERSMIDTIQGSRHKDQNWQFRLFKNPQDKEPSFENKQGDWVYKHLRYRWLEEEYDSYFWDKVVHEIPKPKM